MGGDQGPDAVIPGAAIIYASMPRVHFLMFGDENKIRPVLARHPELTQSCTICHTDKVVKSDDKPSAAVRAGKGTSMRMAIEAVQEGKADAVVSSGNTG